MSTRPNPYVKKDPGDIILAADWNEVQMQSREALAAHGHSGGDDASPIARAGIAPNAVDGTRIDPQSDVALNSLKVNGRVLLDEIDKLLASVTGLSGGKLDRAGDTVGGSLSVKQDLSVFGRLRLNDGTIALRPGTDSNHGLGWFGTGKNFGPWAGDGPVLFGWAGGGLGTNLGGSRLALSWDAAGTVYWNNSQLRTDHGGSIELGGSSTVAGTGTPFIDFHFKGKQEDFNVRLINDGDRQLSLLGNLQVGGSTGVVDLSVGGTLRLNDRLLALRGGSDNNHGLSYYGGGKTFGAWNGDGPVLYGNLGGALGTSAGGLKTALSWDWAGTVAWGNSQLGTDQGGNIELGGSNGVAGTGTPYIDFHFRGKQEDFNVRVINDADSQLSVFGSLNVTGRIYAGNSDLYFTRTDHNHSGFGNTAGYAAIENTSNFDALMVLGRSNGQHPTKPGVKLRMVKLWDFLDVNGEMRVTGNFLEVNGGGGERCYIGGDGAGNDVQLGSLNSTVTNVAMWNTVTGPMALYAKSFNQNSDLALKDNVEALTGGLSKVLALRGVRYSLKAEDEAARDEPNTERHLGFIAQEVQAILPEVVSESHGLLTLSYTSIVPLLVEAIKEQQIQIDALRAGTRIA